MFVSFSSSFNTCTLHNVWDLLNASSKAARNVSQLSRTSEFFSHKGANQESACPVSRAPINPIWAASVRYQC